MTGIARRIRRSGREARRGVDRRARARTDGAHGHDERGRCRAFSAARSRRSCARPLRPALSSARHSLVGHALHARGGVQRRRDAAVMQPGRGARRAAGGPSDAAAAIWDLLECVLRHAKGDICGMNPDDLRKCLASGRRRTRRARAKERARMSAASPRCRAPPWRRTGRAAAAAAVPARRHHRPGHADVRLEPARIRRSARRGGRAAFARRKNDGPQGARRRRRGDTEWRTP